VSGSRSTEVLISNVCDSFGETKVDFHELFGVAVSDLIIMEEKVYLLIDRW
jgi:hypothetical protein